MQWFYRQLSKVLFIFKVEIRLSIFYSTDIFLQYRIALTWIYPAVKQAAYRPGDFNPQRTIHKSNSLHVQPVINTNQNYASADDRPRKRKCSTKFTRTTAARDDLMRYLSEKKLHNRGLVNIRKYNSSKNLFH